MLDYTRFLESKIVTVERSGFDVDPSELPAMLFPHQRDMVTWAAGKGRALISASFGLGKTITQCTLAQLIVNRTQGRFLIISPLGVKLQFQEEDGPQLGQRWEYVRTDEEVKAATTPFLITNYERVRDGDIDPRQHDFAGVSLDEGSVLRSLGSKTYQTFNDVFADVPYRFVATATPSPNDYIELNNYADFLDIMDRGQILTRWFKRDSTKAGHLTLYPQHEQEYWLWVSSWALFIYRPSDLGYSDEGYELPELRVHWHRVAVDQTRAFAQMDNRGQRRLFLDAAGGVSEASAEKRATLNDRIDKMLEILAEHPDRHWLLWHDLEDERRAIEKAVPDSVSVYGSQDLETREKRILDFSHGKISILATKPRISGSGCNFQYHCYSAIFLGVGYKFQDFIQAIHRIFRFLQDHPVDIHIIYASSEDNVVRVLKRKWSQHNKLVAKMESIVKKYGLSENALHSDLARTIGVKRVEEKGELFTAVNNDCVREMPNIADNSIDLIHTSIPFGNHYEYSTHLEDFGHNPSDQDFWVQMDYLIPALYRVLKPGRVAAIHVKDRILYGHQTESRFMEVSPFSDDCVAAFRAHGWLYEGRRTIVTDVVRENSSTYRLGWTEMSKDSTKMGSGLPEYILLFRKPPSSSENSYADEPVSHSKIDRNIYTCSVCGYRLSNKDKTSFEMTGLCPNCKEQANFQIGSENGYSRGRWQIDAHSLWRSSGNRPLAPDELADLLPDQVAAIFENEQLHSTYDHERHVAINEALEKRGRLPASFMLLPPKVTQSIEDMVWDDVIYMRTLNSQQSRKRQENHICPLPFDIVERVIRLYSNPDDLILDPFGGLGTVAVEAIRLGRKAYVIELNGEYFVNLVGYCQDMERQVTTPTLFDYLDRVKANGNGNKVAASAD